SPGSGDPQAQRAACGRAPRAAQRAVAGAPLWSTSRSACLVLFAASRRLRPAELVGAAGDAGAAQKCAGMVASACAVTLASISPIASRRLMPSASAAARALITMSSAQYSIGEPQVVSG